MLQTLLLLHDGDPEAVSRVHKFLYAQSTAPSSDGILESELPIVTKYYSTIATVISLDLDSRSVKISESDRQLEEIDLTGVRGLLYITEARTPAEVSRIDQIEEVICREEREGDMFVVGVSMTPLDDNEDLIGGVEWVEFSNLEMNKFKEKRGKERLWECIECGSWEPEEVHAEEEVVDDEEDELGEFVGDEMVDLTQLISQLRTMKDKLSTMNPEDRHDKAFGLIEQLGL